MNYENFEIEVKNMFMTNSYNMQENKKIWITLNWLGIEGVQVIQTLTEAEHEKCMTSARLLNMLSEKWKKFKPKYNETMLSFQYCKLIREQSENAEEWMGHCRIKANECEYKEEDRRLK